MTLPTVDLLSCVIPPTSRTDGIRTLHRLGVDRPRGRHRIATRLIPHRIPQPIMDAVDGAIGPPDCEVVVHRRPRWQVTRQLPPGTPRTSHLEDRVDDLPTGMSQRSSPPASAPLRWQQRLHQRPLRIGQIRRITMTTSMITHPPNMMTP
jgi:hypothetical protein